MKANSLPEPLPSKNFLNSTTASVAAWCLPITLIVAAIAGLRPPRPVPANAPANEFSAERALKHVREIAEAPHPLGSNESVRQYLAKQLAELEMEPQVVVGIGVARDQTALMAGRTQNILACLKGAANSESILLVAHYDSVPTGPGAADDGAGIAAILETLRALRAGPQLKNDVRVLFTDGEEEGLLGAEALAAAPNSRLQHVGLVLNFEGRGNRGPSLLFETSAGNAQLMKEMARSATHPVASSLFYTLYQRLSSSTDFNIFRKRSTPGFNFAFGSGLEAYHSRLDTIDNLSPASLQHHGSYALALTRHFGALDLSALPKQDNDAVFFNWFGNNLVVYDQRWVLLGEILRTLLVILTLVLALRREIITLRGLGRALLGVACLVVLVPAVVAIAWLAVTTLFGSRLLPVDSFANSLLLTGCVLLSTAVSGGFFAFLRRKSSLYSLWIAGLLLISVLSCIVALLLPGGSYLLFWPAALMSLGAFMIELRRDGTLSAAYPYASLAGLIAALLLFAPLVYLVYVFMTLQLAVIFAAALFVALTFIIGAPLMAVAAASDFGRRVTKIALPAGAFACLLAGIVLSRHSPSHPRHDGVVYSMNVNANTAKWISFDRSPDTWSSQFFPNQLQAREAVPDYVVGEMEPALASPANLVTLPVPEAVIQSDEKAGDVHNLRLSVRSWRSADVMHVVFAENVRCLTAEIAGRTVPCEEGSAGLRVMLYGMSNESVQLALKVKTPGGLSFWLMDQTFGLPFSPVPRTAEFSPWPGTNDGTLVSRKYDIEDSLARKTPPAPAH